MNKLVQFTILFAVLGLIGCQSLKDRMSGHESEKSATAQQKDEKSNKTKSYY